MKKTLRFIYLYIIPAIINFYLFILTLDLNNLQSEGSSIERIFPINKSRSDVLLCGFPYISFLGGLIASVITEKTGKAIYVYSYLGIAISSAIWLYYGP
jgi:hypothetical protein